LVEDTSRCLLEVAFGQVKPETKGQNKHWRKTELVLPTPWSVPTVPRNLTGRAEQVLLEQVEKAGVMRPDHWDRGVNMRCWMWVREYLLPSTTPWSDSRFM